MIELLTVVSIIAILAAVALPAYQDYTVRSRISEALVLASELKAGIITNASQGAADLSADSTPVTVATGLHNVASSAVDPSNGEITMVTTVRAGNGTLRLTPTDASGVALLAGTPPAGPVSWTCTATLAQKYLPRSCTGI